MSDLRLLCPALLEKAFADGWGNGARFKCLLKVPIERSSLLISASASMFVASADAVVQLRVGARVAATESNRYAKQERGWVVTQRACCVTMRSVEANGNKESWHVTVTGEVRFYTLAPLS